MSNVDPVAHDTFTGNAKVAGLQEDLNMTGSEYNLALTIFFIGYVSGKSHSKLHILVGWLRWFVHSC